MERARPQRLVVAIVATGVFAVASSCSDERGKAPPEATASKEQLLDSKYCGGCHREQYDEWAGSMHAYAADDPIFRALNARMQREVPEAEKGFCLNCHAPMAARTGLAPDLARIDQRPELKGVTCYFCHAMSDVHGTNNNPLDLGDPPVFGAAIRDPVNPVVHRGEYRSWQDGTQDNQSGMCGPCHDIVTVGGAHIERTFREWAESRFGRGERTKTSCAACHMPSRPGQAAVTAGAPQRTVHDHTMVGVDLALTPFPGKELQRARTTQFLDDAINTKLCVERGATDLLVDVTLANQRVGHGWPSGSNQDRRAWVELTAWSGTAVVFERGHVPDDVAVSKFSESDLFVLRDRDFDGAGQETHMFWRTTRFTSNQVPAATAGQNEGAPVHIAYRVPPSADRVAIVLRIRPIDLDLVEDLATGGDLDRSTIEPITTFSLAGSRREWRAGQALPCSP